MKRYLVCCLIALLSISPAAVCAQDRADNNPAAEKGISRDKDDQQAMYLSSQVLFTNKLGKLGLFGIGYYHAIARFVRTGGKLHLAVKDMGDASSQKLGLNVTYDLGVQLPLAIGKARLTPYVTPDLGITYFFNDDRWTMLNYGMFAGIELSIPAGESSFIIGADYNLQGISKLGRRNSASVSEGPIHGVGAHIGLAF